jgi:release factor glutamine methyltransferase
MNPIISPGMTGAQALSTAVRWLRSSDVDNAPLDGRRLLAHCMKPSGAGLAGVMQDPLTSDQIKEFERMIRQRMARQPVAQIIGSRHFMTRKFKVTSDVMDPRPETETLIEIAEREPYTHVLDLGVGSGAILLTLLANQLGVATGVGIDKTEEACVVAYANAQATGVLDAADIFISDWFQYVEGRFDLIVSNPPYIALDEMDALAPEVKDWEPRHALTDEGDGLDAYRAIAAGLMDFLKPNGRFLCEIGPTQASAVTEILTQAGLTEVETFQDMDGRDRVVQARHPIRSV